MFEIHGRHKPMFVMSDIKCCAELFTNSLGIDQLDSLEPEVEILSISQTVRLNENNEFIVKSKLDPSQVQSALNQHPAIKQLALSENAPRYMEKILSDMVDRFGVDSYFCIGEQTLFPTIEKILKKATAHSRKPLAIFNTSQSTSFRLENQTWYDLDHPAIWIGQKNWGYAMAGVEAFFAMSPAFKLEVGLNRYQSLGGFQNFFVGLVKF